MIIADYGPWSDFASGRTPESYIEDALGYDPAGYDLYAASAAFRRAVCEALPDGVTLAGHHFFGPYEAQNCEWDSPLDIRDIIDSIDPEPIIKAHQTGGGDHQAPRRARDAGRHRDMTQQKRHNAAP
jgi:hypothetical protein